MRFPRMTPPPSAPDVAVKPTTIRIVVFIICVGVGFACSLFVQQLQSDPRKQVRQTLATQLENRNSQIDELTTDVNNLRSQVDEQSKKISGSVKSDTLIQDEMVNGATSSPIWICSNWSP